VFSAAQLLKVSMITGTCTVSFAPSYATAGILPGAPFMRESQAKVGS
jgi:hypothetical protein